MSACFIVEYQTLNGRSFALQVTLPQGRYDYLNDHLFVEALHEATLKRREYLCDIDSETNEIEIVRFFTDPSVGFLTKVYTVVQKATIEYLIH